MKSLKVTELGVGPVMDWALASLRARAAGQEISLPGWMAAYQRGEGRLSTASAEAVALIEEFMDEIGREPDGKVWYSTKRAAAHGTSLFEAGGRAILLDLLNGQEELSVPDEVKGVAILQSSSATFLALGGVEADWFSEDLPAVPAYLSSDNWNGYAVPYFTREAADALMRQTPELHFDEARNCFYTDEDREENDDAGFEAIPLHVGGSTIEVYPIGAMSWCWHRAETERSNEGPEVPGMKG